MAAAADDKGWNEERQAGFAAGAPLEVYEAIYRLVLMAYGYRCALTGEQFAPDVGLIHPHLEVIAIRPRKLGGPLEISNYLALEEHAARAFRNGIILIGDDYSVDVARPEALDRALAVRLHPGARLLVPEEAIFRPSPAHLAYYRRLMLER
jgi:predicted restriction endonuclease